MDRMLWEVLKKLHVGKRQPRVGQDMDTLDPSRVIISDGHDGVRLRQITYY